MKNERNHGTSTPEMVTISRAEYESLKAERDELSQKLDWLLEQGLIDEAPALDELYVELYP